MAPWSLKISGRPRYGRWVLIGTLWLLSVVVAGMVGYAQTLAPQVISGSDLGFVMEGQRDGRAMGHFVVRVNGKWIPAGGSGLVPAR